MNRDVTYTTCARRAALALVALAPLASALAQSGVPDVLAPIPPAPRTNGLPLAAVIERTLATHPRLRELRDDVNRRAGDVVEWTSWRSPEILGGVGWGDEMSHRTGTRVESGRRSESGRASSAATTRQLGFTTDKRSRQETSQRDATYRTSREAEERARESESEFEVGLRLFPPNPWLLRGEKDAARAAHDLAEARLWDETQALACDLVEVAVRVHYASRLLAQQAPLVSRARAMLTHMEGAVGREAVALADEMEMAGRAAAAMGDASRIQESIFDLQGAFAQLSGTAVDDVNLDPLRPGALLRLPALNAEPGAESGVRQLARRRGDVLMAVAGHSRAAGEWKMARSRRMPWLGRVELAYSNWDVDESSIGTFTESGSAAETRRAQSREFRPATFEVQDEAGWGTSRETTHGTGTDSAAEERAGDAWWVGAAVEIPVFEWLSRESRVRRAAWQGARASAALVLERAEQDIRAAADLVRATRRHHAAQVIELNRLRGRFAASPPAAEADLATEADALRWQQNLVAFEVRVTEAERRCVLAELAFCRAAGLIPLAAR
ncbi:MAG: hypothetical protein K8T26_17905 [Lentisphaerae bacterium]|nr:hypothetical protein [Lentisphaerota bacterium]